MMKTFKQYFEEEYEYKPGEGLDTSWSDQIDGKKVTVTIKEVLEYLDNPDEHGGKKVPVQNIDTDRLKAILIAADRDPERVAAANLDKAVIVVVDMNGNYKSILDGNHRVEKAIDQNEPTVKTRELDLRTAPKEYKALFNYEIEKDEKV